jgi:hypothetical protein
MASSDDFHPLMNYGQPPPNNNYPPPAFTICSTSSIQIVLNILLILNSNIISKDEPRQVLVRLYCQIRLIFVLLVIRRPAARQQ